MPKTYKVCLVAGEASGDQLGADLMAALKRLPDTDFHFIGIGGPGMSAEGLSSLFPMSELSIMGLAEVLPKARALLKRIRETQDYILAERPDVIITIDAPSFCFRVVKKLTSSGIPRVHYVAPQAWAWRPWRAKELRHLYDRVLALLPFEPEFFANYGVEARFIGHPVVARIEMEKATAEPAQLRKSLAIPDNHKILLMLPGSRHSETKRMLPVFAETLQRFSPEDEPYTVLLPTVPNVEQSVQATVSQWDQPVHVIAEREKHKDAFAAAHIGLAASGTVSLELLLHGVPSIIGYRVNPVTAAIIKQLLQTRFVSIANILSDEEVMPEFLQSRCEPALIAAALSEIYVDGPQRQRQIDGSTRVANMLSGLDQNTPSERAAKEIMDLIETA